MTDPQTPRLAVDIGGTFTDIAIETAQGITTAKTLTTPGRPVEGVLQGIAYGLERAGLVPADFGAVLHGTTLATNALIERRGARVAVIATQGFRDILEIGYERRYDQYDLYLEKPDLIVPRDLVFTVRERMDASGGALVPLDPASLQAAIDGAVAAGADALAVCLLHSYRNPAHEQAVRDMAATRAPGLAVSLSSEVSPEIREFDRLCTTVCNAYIQPLMATYLAELETALAGQGFDCPLFIVTSGGGMTTVETARAFPIRLVESGPSGGAVLAARVAAECGIDNALSFDMGGTTAKVCLIEDATPQSSSTFEIDRAERFLKGSGIPVRIPVIDMIEIGAGGGSIASVDALGRLRVGPKSASSDPGPACYGKGGQDPTVTDSDLALGFISPDGFAEGRFTIDPAKAAQAIEQAVSGPLGTDTSQGADGIGQMVDEAMANAARMHAAERGKDLRACTMIAFGGNGPLHAARVAEKIGVERIIVPPDPSVGSAVGFLSAPVAYEIVQSHHARITGFDFAAVNALLEQLIAEASAIVSKGAGGAALQTRRTAFMRYAGQGHEIEVAIPAGPLNADTLDQLVAAYEAEYAHQFGRTVPEMEIEVMNWAVVVSTTAAEHSAPADPAPLAAPAPAHHRAVLIAGVPTQTPVHARAELAPGAGIAGPALIAEPQTTTWVAPGFAARIDGAGNIVMSRQMAPCRPGLDPGPHAAASGGPGSSPGQPAENPDIALQVMWDRLLAIVEEQGQALMRAAFSEIVRECGDISAGIFDVTGRMLAQAVTGTPGHINTMAMAVGLMLEHIPAPEMAEGDIYATNDPWIGAGHLNDVLLVAPIFRDGRLIAFSSCTSHVYDIGGSGMGPDGRDVHDEGLYLPPCRLVSGGDVDRTILNIIKANSRAPVAIEGDVYALIACCDTADRRLLEMLAEFGIADIDALGAHILARSQAATEAAIATIPNGVYAHEMMIDGYEAPIRLAATMTVEDRRIAMDFTGTDGPVARGINVPINYTAAYGVFATRCVVAPLIPNNAGSLAPFVTTAPPDTIVNAQPPAAVGSRHSIGHMVADLALGCLAQALPGRVPAEGASCLWDLPLRNDALAALSGKATAFATEFSHNGGTGARPSSDGLSATAYPSGVWGTQVESAEASYPVRYRRRELIADSGGPGKYRGGLGQMIEFESSEGAPILFFGTVERTRFAAAGRDGGGDGRLGRMTLRSGPSFQPKGEQVIPAGDLLYFETPGGGGYGDPADRDPERVAQDVRLGLVSAKAARRIYRVALAEDGSLDEAATHALRQG